MSYQANRFFLCFCLSLLLMARLLPRHFCWDQSQIYLVNRPTFRLNFTLLVSLIVSPGVSTFFIFICFSPISKCWEVWGRAWNLICLGTTHLEMSLWPPGLQKWRNCMWPITQNKLCCHHSSNDSSPSLAVI